MFISKTKCKNKKAFLCASPKVCCSVVSVYIHAHVQKAPLFPYKCCFFFNIFYLYIYLFILGHCTRCDEQIRNHCLGVYMRWEDI